MPMESTVYGQDEHLLYARIGPVVVAQVLPDHTDASFEIYLSALERELGARREDERVAVLFYVPGGGTWDAGRRKRVNDVLARYVVKRRRTTSVWVLCTPSAATRGVATALFWVVPPPYEYRIRADLGAGLEDVREKHPDFSPSAFSSELARITRRR
ncbi:hypothetical protein DB32_008880 [Sandaracinus amylolyticus]|uniref:STAS/SEC14 domain-containing protein n=2 Tax=Sandaracinus amylolyticus TaxID=927083 RepID=A0A0F6WAP4_9BACT|nr:hypothetical protein DB32_008880 [Sandaracinus amylolyticus]